MRQGYKENGEMLCGNKRLGNRRLTNEKNWNHWKKVKGKAVRIPQRRKNPRH